MPRTARKKSETGIYHIILRGINRQSIFEDNEDREKLLQTMIRYKEKCRYSIYAYCFMDNHFHLLLKEGEEPLEQIMRRISGSYVYWYNKKYERIGNLFQDRFKSEPVETDSYFLTVIRYIHQNPIKAGITRKIKDYKWSSYSEYLERKKIIDREYVLKNFAEDKVVALELFMKFNNECSDDKCLEIEEKKKKISDDELRQMIKSQFKVEAWTLQNEPKEKKQIILKKALEIEGISTRQLARVTGISANTIWKL
ncbi:transposase [Clostridium aceticum]|uniref:Transposase n=1 Tax=Clostridium aceticum TaxID=84022 RepID=A0A0D8IBA2_9CLOT|nr:transposase [Clostridium aceticum]AKL96519.1 transposase [Clostridium aceticum]KJF27312.1 transposase [Clostridium aceticum]